jgi:RNA 2',3'-cyclic 3'-phosphodiesterase
MGIRAFFAVDLEPGVRKHLARAVSMLPLGDTTARPVKADNLHITMHFLGDIADEEVMVAHEAGARAAVQFEPFELSIGEIVCVPPEGRLRMLSANVDDSAGQLADLYAELGQQLGPEGFRVDHRPFKPHVTLARFRSPPRDDAVQQAVADAMKSFGRVMVDELVLYSSQKTKGGPVYSALARSGFGGQE